MISIARHIKTESRRGNSNDKEETQKNKNIQESNFNNITIKERIEMKSKQQPA